MTIVPLAATTVSDADLRDLVDLLVACVAAGASIGFLAPLAPAEAEAYWRTIFADLASGRRLVLVARDASRIVGTAQLALETRPNGRHRAEVQKVMVAPSHRRRGLGSRLIAELEAQAHARHIRLLFLDTSDSHAGARNFYTALAYTYVGGIPGYATDPQGRLEPNAIFYKTLVV